MPEPRLPMSGKKKKPVKKSSVKPAAKKKAPAKPVAKAAPKKKIVAKPAKKPEVPKKGLLKKAAGKVMAVAKKAVASKPIPKEEAKSKKAGKEKPIVNVSVELPVVAVPAEEEEVVLTDAEGRRYCRVKDCDQVSAVDGYCRYHYLLFWKKIQVRKKILSEGKLERYIEDLTARYPDKFLDMLRKDLRSEKEFLAAIAELEIDESSVDNEFEDETQNYLDEVRGMGSEAVTTRDDDDF